MNVACANYVTVACSLSMNAVAFIFALCLGDFVLFLLSPGRTEIV